ncbi:MAG: YraN family protein [Lachnospiraceae bacterium]|nr:YraN family protein [Candidatus Darwinimomas equi]
MNKRVTGSQYEDIACSFLTDSGMKVIQRNYRIRTGEIDIVAMDGRTVVFVEVKYRGNSHAGTALEAVSAAKRKQIIRVARYYLYSHHIPETVNVRFDCVGIDGHEVKYVRNAFDAEGSIS